MKEDMTKPPKLFKDASLLTLMEKAHLQIKDPQLKKALKEADGIGTAATRASFPPLLMKRGYIIKTNDGNYIPTELGIKLFDILPEELTIPDFSANLEQELSGFIKKKALKSETEIISETEAFLKKVFEKIRRNNYVFNTNTNSNPIKKDYNKISDKQRAVIEKNAPADIKEALQNGDFVKCNKWIDDFFDSMRKNSRPK